MIGRCAARASEPAPPRASDTGGAKDEEARLGNIITRRRARRAVAALLAGLLASLVLVSAVPVVTAQDDGAAFRDLATGSDFRIRVAAALSLGKSRSSGARPALEKALGDAHPAVRSAAAAALGSLGNAAAVPALQAASAREAAPNVKSEMDLTIKRLQATPSPTLTKAKFLVSLGKLENKSGVTSATLLPTLKTSTRTKMAQVPGVEVLAEGADPSVEGRSRNLPAFTLDASLTQLAKRQGSDGIGYAARVEYLIRKMPDQTLKGTMSGAAQAIADAKEIRGQSELSQLQLDALSAAVDSALKGASPALEAATR